MPGSFPQAQRQKQGVLPLPSPPRVSPARNLLPLHPPEAAARAASSPHPGAAVGWKGTYFPETPMALKAPTVLLKTPSSLTSEAARPDPTSAATPRPRIFLPPRFCLKAFSLCERLSTAFLSSSSQRGGRFSFEPELHRTTGRRRRWKGLRRA